MKIGNLKQSGDAQQARPCISGIENFQKHFLLAVYD